MPDTNSPEYRRRAAAYRRELDRIAAQTQREAQKWGKGYAWQNEEQPQVRGGRKVPKRPSGIGKAARAVFGNKHFGSR